MSRLLPRLTLAAVTAAALAAPTPGSAQVAIQTAVAGLRPAVAGGQIPALAWTVHSSDGSQRVVASVPADMPAISVGPAQEGDDGAPALAALPGGRFLLLAARTHGTGSTVWASEWNNGWRSAVSVPASTARNHHPAVATSGDTAWAVWVGSDRGESSERLFASRRDRRGWSPAEPVPGAPGTPMAPRIAVDQRGRPLVVWAANDGHDAEIWYSRRGAAGWLPATALSDSDVPDVEPDVAFVAGRPTVAWARFADDGYRPMAATGNRQANRFATAQRLDHWPGSGAVVISTPAGVGVAWTSIADDARTSELRAVALGGRRQTPAVLGRVASARVTAAGTFVAWAGSGAPGLGVVAGPAGERRQLRLEPLVGSVTPPVRRIDPVLPGTYRGFGDSITEGVVVSGGEIVYTDGYPVPLAELLSDLLDRQVLVVNDGVAGEMTSEGLERLAGLVFGNPKLFNMLMEGTNDVSALLDADTIVTNLRAMVRRVQSVGGIAVVGTLIPRVNEGDGGVRDEHTSLVNAGIKTMVVEEGAMIVDQNAAFFDKATLYSDRLHPSLTGYDYMASVWFRALQPLLVHLLRQEETENDRSRDDLLMDARRRGIR